MGLGGGHVLAGEEHLERAAAADQPRQPLRAGIAGDDPEVDLGLPEPRRVGGDPERAGHRQLAAAAEREAVDRGDHRFAEVLDQVEDVLPRPRMFAAADRRLHRQLVDVGAGDERLLARTR